MELEPMLRHMVENDGSDLYLTVGAPPSVKIHGRLTPVGEKSLEPSEVKAGHG